MFSVLSGLCWGVELLGHRVTAFNCIRGYQIEFQQLYRFVFTPLVDEGFGFSISLPVLVVRFLGVSSLCCHES